MNASVLSLAGKVAVVTGSSRGIGHAIARAFLRAGARVAGCSQHDADAALAFARAADIDASATERAAAWRCDVRRHDEVDAFAKAALARFGAPDVLVNNAGIVARGPLAVMSEDTWDDVVDANLKGTFLVTRAFLPAMQQRGGGRIINIASIAGRQGTALLSAYCAAKHGVVGLSRALAEELRPSGIAVNALCPGSVDTDMLKVGMPGGQARMTAPEIADVALFLATQAPLAMNGACIDVFG